MQTEQQTLFPSTVSIFFETSLVWVWRRIWVKSTLLTNTICLTCILSYPNCPSVNFINVNRARFSYEWLFSSYILALNELSYEKSARLTLMKLTASYDPTHLTRVASPQKNKRRIWPILVQVSTKTN